MGNDNSSAALLGLHAVTSMHPGSGAALGLVDLPIQRERHTHWPNISGSAMKGILRDRCREGVAVSGNFDYASFETETDAFQQLKDSSHQLREKADATKTLTTLFGPPTTWASEFAGALSVTDARLIAFPVRSMCGVFAWVTCNAALQRLRRDAAMAKLDFPDVSFSLPKGHFCCTEECQCLHEEKYVVLEEFDFQTEVDTDQQRQVGTVARWLGDHIADCVDETQLQQQLVVLPDDDFTHFARYATEVVARIRLDYDTKTVADGALFYQEFLPPETLMYSLVIANRARGGGKRNEEEQPLGGGQLLEEFSGLLLGSRDSITLQIGGDESTGKGLCSAKLKLEASS